VTLSRRVALLVALGSALASLLVAVVAVVVVRDALIRSVDRALVDRLLLLADAPEALPRIFAQSAQAGAFTDRNGPVLLVDAVIAGSLRPATGVTATVPVTAAALALAPGGGILLQTVPASGGEPVRVAALRVSDSVVVRTMRSTAEVDRVVQRIAVAIAVLGIGVCLAVGAIGVVVVSRVLRPLGTLAQTAQRVAHTQDVTDPGIDADMAARRDEVGRLAEAMRRMLTALATARQQRQRLLDDAAHELRTPLTSVRANVDLLARAVAHGRGLDEPTARATVADLDTEVSGLTALVEEVLAVAGTAEVDRGVALIDLAEVIGEVVERIRRRTGRLIHVTGQPVSIRGDRVAVARAVGNIIGNAVKFSPPATGIEVTVGPSGVTVDDAGPGIPIADRAHAVERFWRAPQARALPGSGLGLAIAADVAHSLGGGLQIDQSPLGGTRVHWWVPPAEPRAGSVDGRDTLGLSPPGASPQ